jgi:DNA-binding winged helix-turn-helix (wHTH) protein/predicted ATPase
LESGALSGRGKIRDGDNQPAIFSDREFTFGRFRFDARAGQLWRDGSEVKLTPRAASVLHALVERAQQLVTKQELFDRVWGGLAVSDDALTSCIQELRCALGDDARRPHTIETRHRRGYRLMVPVEPIAERSAGSQSPATAAEPSTLVGRAGELGELARCFEEARAGRRQVIFVTGEPGIGKSALADAFLDQLRGAYAVKISLGQCLDHHGVGEPYLPLIEALTRLAGAPHGGPVKEILAAQAPSWLAQMPSLWTRSERGVLEARGRPTRERMMRELTHAVEAIASDAPLVLKLEDMHWSDEATLDWVGHAARRPEAARLMVLGTFRPADAAAVKTRLVRLVTELALHGSCREIALRPLGLHAVENYLKIRSGTDGSVAQLRQMAPMLLERTGGNPLFMTSIVNQFAQQNASGRTLDAIDSIPDDVRRFIDGQIDELADDDRNLLTAASVVGREFATAALAAALEREDDEVEADCARLARHGTFIAKSVSTAPPASVAWPDGTPTELYSFRHDLYRELLYGRLLATRRALYHTRVGRRLAAAWSGGLDAIASELAEHFERANDPVGAIPHHHRAATKALRRSANAEAISHLQQALNAVAAIKDEVDRAKSEVELLVNLGAAFMATRGFGAPEVLDAYSRAEALCDRLGERADIFPALWGQWLFRWGRSEIDAAWRLCERLLALAERSGDAGLKLQAHHASWATSFGLGRLAEVRAHAEAGLALYDAKIHQPMASSYGNHDAGICARYFAALSLALAGENDRARAMADTAVAVAQGLNDSFSLALALYFAAVTAQILGDAALAVQRAEASRQLATEHDLAMPRAWSAGIIGWCAAENGDPKRATALLTDAVAALHAAHSRHFMPYLLGLLAQAHMKLGNHTDAMMAVEEGVALADAGGERFYSAELHRLKGELLASASDGCHPAATEAFRTAIELAKQQGATALERRAKASLQCWSGIEAPLK